MGVATPFGGAEATLSSNPIAFGVPTADGRHLISDFATTMLANAKINVYRMKGMELPPGCIVDKDGRPSTDPNDFNAGGKSLVFGGYKRHQFCHGQGISEKQPGAARSAIGQLISEN